MGLRLLAGSMALQFQRFDGHLPAAPSSLALHTPHRVPTCLSLISIPRPSLAACSFSTWLAIGSRRDFKHFKHHHLFDFFILAKLCSYMVASSEKGSYWNKVHAWDQRGAAIACSFDEDPPCTAVFSCTSHFGASLSLLPPPASLQTASLLLDTSQTDPAAVPPHCSGGTWCCLAQEVWGAGQQRLVAVAAARLLPGESPCPSISRQSYFWWPAWSSTSAPMGL